MRSALMISAGFALAIAAGDGDRPRRRFQLFKRDADDAVIERDTPGKLDIAEAIATEDYSKHLTHLRKLALQAGRSARERLHDLLFEELRRTYHKLEKDPRVVEMARTIGQERPQFANWMLENERKVLVELFEEAERRGEFRMKDKEFTAEMVQ